MKDVGLSKIEAMIYLIRGQKVMLDSDLAELYGVETKALNRQVTRNEVRFPEDFMFRLTSEEHESLRCQNGTSKDGRGGRRYLPLVFKGMASPQSAQSKIPFNFRYCCGVGPPFRDKGPKFFRF